MGVRHHTLTHCLSTSLPLATAQVLKTSIMATRAVAVAGSRSAAAAESSTMMASRKTTKTTTYKTDASGNVSESSWKIWKANKVFEKELRKKNNNYKFKLLP